METSGNNSFFSRPRPNQRLLLIKAIALHIVIQTRHAAGGPRNISKEKQRAGKPKRVRARRTVQDIYDSLGPIFFRRAYRMSLGSFKCLVEMLIPFLKQRNLEHARTNGPILPEVRVACAIRYFAGGSPYDIATSFGVAFSEIFESVWEVVDALHKSQQFSIVFPVTHGEQRDLALNFFVKSAAGFQICAGAIDGILIWIRKPSPQDCKAAACDTGKFFCGRKNKFGMNCQAVCDARGRFTGVGIRFPGSTADCLAFEGMPLYKSLMEGVLAPDLCIFGDNAYINAPFLATPYQGVVAQQAKDAYNFYHSQLRITIECAFGQLTQRWGILRSAFPVGLSIKKISYLTMALFKLHNYCIDMNQNEILEMTAQDERFTELCRNQ